MKKILSRLMFSLSISLGVLTINPILTTANENIPESSATLVYDAQKNITGVQGIKLEGKTYNIKFVYGNFQDKYQGMQDPLLVNIPDPILAINEINSLLNSLQPIPKVVSAIPKKPKYPSAYKTDIYMIPVQVINRSYGKQTSTEIYAVFGYFDKETGRWTTASNEYVKHGLSTAGVYTQFRLIFVHNSAK